MSEDDLKVRQGLILLAMTTHIAETTHNDFRHAFTDPDGPALYCTICDARLPLLSGKKETP